MRKKNLRPSAAKCVQILGTKNASGQMSLLNTNAGLAEILRTGFLEPRDIGHDRWTLATLRFALGRASADRVATTTQIEKLRGVCPSRFVHARRPVQWPRQMGFSHIYIYIFSYVPVKVLSSEVIIASVRASVRPCVRPAAGVSFTAQARCLVRVEAVSCSKLDGFVRNIPN